MNLIALVVISAVALVYLVTALNHMSFRKEDKGRLKTGLKQLGLVAVCATTFVAALFHIDSLTIAGAVCIVAAIWSDARVMSDEAEREEAKHPAQPRCENSDELAMEDAWIVGVYAVAATAKLSAVVLSVWVSFFRG